MGYTIPDLDMEIVILSLNHTNSNEESSLVGNAAPMSANSRYVIEDLVTNTLENAPQMPDTPTSNRSGFRARLVGGSGIRQLNITVRRQMFSSDTFPSPASDEQRWRFQFETEAAEAEVRAERKAILRLQIETERAELDARKAAAVEALATSRHRICELTRGTPSPKSPRSPHRAPSSPRVWSLHHR